MSIISVLDARNLKIGLFDGLKYLLIYMRLAYIYLPGLP